MIYEVTLHITSHPSNNISYDRLVFVQDILFSIHFFFVSVLLSFGSCFVSVVVLLLFIVAELFHYFFSWFFILWFERLQNRFAILLSGLGARAIRFVHFGSHIHATSRDLVPHKWVNNDVSQPAGPSPPPFLPPPPLPPSSHLRFNEALATTAAAARTTRYF